MPISSIHFRAEIGLFYNVLHSCYSYGSRKKCDFPLMHQLLPSYSHLITFSVLLTVFPLIILFSLIIGKTNLCKIFRTSYVVIYFCVRLVQKLSPLRNTRRKILRKFFLQYVFFVQLFMFLPHISVYLIMCGDIEINPGPSNKQDLSLCHWNLNSICANDFVKVSLLEAYTAVHDFDIICLSETFLNSDVSTDEERLILPGYAPMIRSDHPCDDKRGGVCVYVRENLPFLRRDDLECHECIVGEIRVKNSRCFITCFYRSPTQ